MACVVHLSTTSTLCVLCIPHTCALFAGTELLVINISGKEGLHSCAYINIYYANNPLNPLLVPFIMLTCHMVF